MPTPSEKEIFKLAAVSVSDFSQKVHQLGQSLGTAEQGDQRVSQLFLDPEPILDERQTLAHALTTVESPANRAYLLIKGLAQFLDSYLSCSSITNPSATAVLAHSAVVSSISAASLTRTSNPMAASSRAWALSSNTS